METVRLDGMMEPVREGAMQCWMAEKVNAPRGVCRGGGGSDGIIGVIGERE